MADATLIVKIVTDATQAVAGADAAAGKFGKFGSAMKKAALPAAAVVAGLTAVGVAAVNSASRTEQAMGGVDAVFGKNAGQVKAWAADAAGSIGLAKSEYGEFATLIGSQLKNAGVPMDKLAGQTKGMIQKGADLAAMFGGTTADAVDALSAALKGEFDPLEKYGTSLSATKIAAQMAADGTDKLTGKAAQNAKAMATLKMIQDQTSDSQGAAAREAGTTAARMQQLSANVENLKSDLGEQLLPVVAAFLGYLSKAATWMAKNKTVVMILAATLGVLALAVLAVNAAMWVMAANPIVLIIAAIIAAIALLAIGFVILWKRSETFRKVVTAVFNSVKSVAKAVASAVAAVWRATWNAVSSAVRTVSAVVRSAFNAIRSVINGAISVVRSLQAWFGRLRVPTSVRSALNAIRSAVAWCVDKVRDLGSAMSRLRMPGAVRSALDGVKNAAQWALNAVRDLAGWLSRLRVPKLHFPSIPKGLRSAPMNAPTSARVSPTVRAGVGAPITVPWGSGGGGTTININGALDPESVARQVIRLLDAHDRRVGGTAARGLRTG